MTYVGNYNHRENWETFVQAPYQIGLSTIYGLTPLVTNGHKQKSRTLTPRPIISIPVEAHAQRRALFNTHLLVSKSNSKPDSCPHRFWSIQLTVCQKHHCSSRHEQYKWPLQTGLASPFAHQLIATSTNFSIIHQSLQAGVPPPPPFYFITIHSVQHSLPLPGLWFAIIYWFI